MTALRRVGLNLLFLVPGETGGSEVYARNLVPRLAEQRPGLELVAFVNREGAELDLGDVEIARVGVSGRRRAGRVLAEQRRVPKLVREHRIELLHSPGTSAPVRPGAVSVVTILDVIYARFPRAHTLPMRIGMRALVPLAARSADRVLTISEAAATDIADVLHVDRDRIDVTHLAGKPPGPATPEAQVRERFDLGDATIVLSASARRPHKNLPRLLDAFAALKRAAATVLVLPGYATAFDRDLQTQARRLGIAERIRLLDWVSDEDLEGLYGAATCFVFPSLAEGFGMPVLEAMERGLPVACSDAGPLPEVGGDAVRYFDPHDQESIAMALAELLEHGEVREELAAAGRERARLFSWERTAQETARSYERAWAERAGSGTTAR